MKKSFIIALAFLFLVGCSCSKQTKDAPSSITNNGKTHNDSEVNNDETSGSNTITENNNKNGSNSNDSTTVNITNADTFIEFKLDINTTYKAKTKTKKDTGLCSIYLKKDGKVEMKTYGWSNEDDIVGGFGIETGTYVIEGNKLILHLTYYTSGVSMDKGKINRKETYIITGNNQFEGYDFKFTKGKLTEEDFDD